MAEGVEFSCEHCGHTIEAWSDGNPYYLDERGRKRYAYHPSPELALCIGNHVPHVCLACGAMTRVDSRAPRDQCRKCRAHDLVATFELGGRPCPYCKQGRFGAVPTIIGIS